MLSKGHEELRDIPDDKLVTAYESMRDNEFAADHTYPNLRRLYGTSLEREKDRREIRQWAENCDAEMQEWYEKARNEPCTWWLQNHLVAKHALKSCIACGVCTSQCPAAQYYPEYNPRTIVDAVLSKSEDRLVELLKSDVLWYCGQCGSCKPHVPAGKQSDGTDLVLALSGPTEGISPAQREGAAAIRNAAFVRRKFVESRLHPVLPEYHG